jgi:DNA-binding NtrC family response regulator
VRHLAVRVLQKYGYTVYATARPAEALELASRHDIAFDLLLTDVVLPDMNGQAVATKVLGLHPLCKVLYMSGYTDEAIVRHGVLDPEAAFLQKPFMAGALVQKVEKVLAS